MAIDSQNNIDNLTKQVEKLIKVLGKTTDSYENNLEESIKKQKEILKYNRENSLLKESENKLLKEENELNKKTLKDKYIQFLKNKYIEQQIQNLKGDELKAKIKQLRDEEKKKQELNDSISTLNLKKQEEINNIIKSNKPILEKNKEIEKLLNVQILENKDKFLITKKNKEFEKQRLEILKKNLKDDITQQKKFLKERQESNLLTKYEKKERQNLIKQKQLEIKAVNALITDKQTEIDGKKTGVVSGIAGQAGRGLTDFLGLTNTIKAFQKGGLKEGLGMGIMSIFGTKSAANQYAENRGINDDELRNKLLESSNNLNEEQNKLLKDIKDSLGQTQNIEENVTAKAWVGNPTIFQEFLKTLKNEKEITESSNIKNQEGIETTAANFSDKPEQINQSNIFSEILVSHTGEILNILQEQFKYNKEKDEDLRQQIEKPESKDKEILPNNINISKEKKGNLSGLGFLLPLLGGLLALSSLFDSGPFKGLKLLLGKGLLNPGKIIEGIKGIGLIFNKFGTLLSKSPLGKIGNIFDDIIKGIAKSPLGKIGKVFGVIGGKSAGIFGKLLKGIPIVGSIFSFASAYSRFKKNDVAGGILDIISGIAGLIPGPWAAAISLITGLFGVGKDMLVNKKPGQDKSLLDNIGLKFKEILDNITGGIFSFINEIMQFFTIDNIKNMGLGALKSIGDFFTGGNKLELSPAIGTSTTTVGDAIITKTGKVIHTSPDDHIVATKNPVNLSSKTNKESSINNMPPVITNDNHANSNNNINNITNISQYQLVMIPGI